MLDPLQQYTIIDNHATYKYTYYSNSTHITYDFQIYIHANLMIQNKTFMCVVFESVPKTHYPLLLFE